MARPRILAAIAWISVVQANILPPVGVPGKVYATFIPEWSVEVFPENFHEFNGTIEKIEREAMIINPHWHKTYFGDDPEPFFAMGKRASFEEFDVNCYHNDFKWGRAKIRAIRDGIKHLNGVKDRPYSRGGPGMCGRVSCSRNSAIYWCNDSEQEKWLGSFKDIAQGAKAVLRSCPRFGYGAHEAVIWGQAFHADKWNVIVRYEKC